LETEFLKDFLVSTPEATDGAMVQQVLRTRDRES
jgi:hypothetical protein